MHVDCMCLERESELSSDSSVRINTSLSKRLVAEHRLPTRLLMALRVPSFESVQLTLIACAIAIVLAALFGIEVLPLALCIGVGIFLVLLREKRP